jgi:type IVB pilus formation R64 PilN family outer membrane protein
MKRLLKITFSIVALAVLLAGCDSIALWKQTNTEYAKDSDVVKDANANVKKPPPPVTDNKQDPYVDTHPVSLNREPSWYTAPVTLNASGLPFSFYVTQLLGNTPVQVHMDPGVNTARTVNMRYSGTVKGAMEELAAKSGYYYDYDLDKNTITWSALQTKTFDISFIPGVSKYNVGSSGGSGASLASGSSSASGSSTTGVDITQTGEYSSIANGSLSVWDDMKNTIATLLSPKGKLSVSQATTTITVRDHPSNITDISRYLDEMNKILSKQVHFEVQVLDVTLNKQFQYGIDWSNVQYFIGSGGGTVNFSANLSGAAGGILSSQSSAAAATYKGGTKSKWNNTTVILNALEQQGKVSIVTQPSVTTLNDQVAQITIQTQQTYLASQSTTITGGGSDLSQQALTPGVINYGFQMYLLPKIQGDKVFLQISSVISNLQSLQTVSQNGQVTTTNGGSSDGNTTNSIQIPILSQKNFNQRSVLKNGETLVLAGYKSLNDANQKDSVAGLTALGGMAATATNEELVVLITPIILDGDNF